MVAEGEEVVVGRVYQLPRGHPGNHPLGYPVVNGKLVVLLLRQAQPVLVGVVLPRPVDPL